LNRIALLTVLVKTINKNNNILKNPSERERREQTQNNQTVGTEVFLTNFLFKRNKMRKIFENQNN
jgi:hypothetical protein